MSTLSLGARGKISGFNRFADAMPWLVQLYEAIERWSVRVGTDNLETAAITNAKLALGAVTPDRTSGGVARIASGQYTGDGTANREVNIGFRAKYVWLIRHSTSMIFEGTGDAASALVAGRRSSAGVWTGSGVADADWQGPSTNGFKLGSSLANLSNINTELYTYMAIA